jgi:hypothetical protein
VSNYIVGRGELIKASPPVLIPQVTYRTNDSWELISAIDGDNGWPVLHDADYLDGQLQVLTIPENFADLSNYPEPVLNAIRRVVTAPLPVKLEAPGKVSLFVYDNGTFIVHNFHDVTVSATVVVNGGAASLTDLVSNEMVAITQRPEPVRPGATPVNSSIGAFVVAPHSFRAFRVN